MIASVYSKTYPQVKSLSCRWYGSSTIFHLTLCDTSLQISMLPNLNFILNRKKVWEKIRNHEYYIYGLDLAGKKSEKQIFKIFSLFFSCDEAGGRYRSIENGSRVCVQCVLNFNIMFLLGMSELTSVLFRKKKWIKCFQFFFSLFWKFCSSTCDLQNFPHWYLRF